MILAVKKYGAVKGIIKGIKRVRRCKPIVDRWEDYP